LVGVVDALPVTVPVGDALRPATDAAALADAAALPLAVLVGDGVASDAEPVGVLERQSEVEGVVE